MFPVLTIKEDDESALLDAGGVCTSSSAASFPTVFCAVAGGMV